MLVSPLDQKIAERISLIRYPMIFLIVVSHVPQLVRYVDDPTLQTFVGTFVMVGT